MGASHADGQRRTLVWVFALNALLAAGLWSAGVAADSAALLANGVDNASDAAVYALGYFAVTRSGRWKILAARISGVTLLLLAAGVLVEAARRFLGDIQPVGPVIMAMSVVAAGVNIACIRLLREHRREDVNLRAAWIFSINDMLANLGALAAGVLVWALGRAWPDLVIAMAIAVIAARGGLEILRDARGEAGR